LDDQKYQPQRHAEGLHDSYFEKSKLIRSAARPDDPSAGKARERRLAMPIFRLAPIVLEPLMKTGPRRRSRKRSGSKRRTSSPLEFYVQDANHNMADFKSGKALLRPPWVDEIVTICFLDTDAKAPPRGHVRTASGKTLSLPGFSDPV
jgi:hypothetical protein